MVSAKMKVDSGFPWSMPSSRMQISDLPDNRSLNNETPLPKCVICLKPIFGTVFSKTLSMSSVGATVGPTTGSTPRANRAAVRSGAGSSQTTF